MSQKSALCHCLAGLLLSLATGSSFALEADDPAWRAFQHGLGEPALIAANAGHDDADEVFRPLPPASDWQIDPDRFRLGSRLFHESRLSTGNGIACVTCHAGTLSGADRRRVSVGVGGAEGIMNALSVFNATFNFRQFWDGRAVTLEDQALLPIETEFEMANSLEAVLQFLRGEPDYVEQFARVYPDGVSIANMADAMAHFQRSTFVRLDTPFQRYLQGEGEALGEQEKFGLQRFREVGCSSCHNGINLGGNSYQRLGALRDYYTGSGGSATNAAGDSAHEAEAADLGLAARSGQENHRYVFRVPALHGVATTPPYFHDGSVTSLEEAVELMAEYQLARRLSAEDVQAITAFLKSLGGHFNSSRDGLPSTEFDLQSGRGAWQIADKTETATRQGNDHADAYRAVLESVPEARQALINELEAIADGRVAHFDFAQFQHLELIRFSRAMAHPPSSLAAAQRDAIAAQADRLLHQVMALEWPIADFLQAHARLAALERLRQLPEAELLLPAGAVGERLIAARARAQQALASVRGKTLDAPLGEIAGLLSGP